MLTGRGRWLLLTALGLAALGLLTRFAPLTLAGLALVFWFLAEWTRFTIQTRILARSLRVVREVRDERGPVSDLWGGRTFTVSATLETSGRSFLSFVRVADLVPFGVERLDGVTEVSGPLSPAHPLEVGYGFRCTDLGRVRFEGLSVEAADLQGFFYWRSFVPDPLTCRVLPVLAETRGTAGSLKRRNILPPPGVHRLSRPGSGSELLNLRDYLAGDPPKTIAWKVSARRGKLITKEFESEVPVRCTLFVDTSDALRLGPTGKVPLQPLLELAAVIAQANARNRDLTGLCLFDEHAARTTAPARDPAHIARLLNQLADAAACPLTPRAVPADLQGLAYTFARTVYPYLLTPDVNSVPFWLPFLGPPPGGSPRRTGWLRLAGRMVFLLASTVGLVIAGNVFFQVLRFAHQRLPDNFAAPFTGFHLLLLGIAAVYYYRFLAVFRRSLPQLFSARRRSAVRRRKHLAAVLSLRHGLLPGGLAKLMEDDALYSQHLQRFLGEHHVPYPPPLYDAEGRFLHAGAGKVAVLATALLRAVGRGHDDELFVLAVDLLELVDRLEPLLKAVRLALARKHQVLIVCPWPPGVPRPQPNHEGRPAEATGPGSPLPGVLGRLTAERVQQDHRRVRAAFSRMGVQVLWEDDRQSVRLILSRIQQLRMAGRTR